jgi:preprotein translocase subunit SecA
MLNLILKKIFYSYNERVIKKLIPLVNRINQLEPEVKSLSDDALKGKTAEFRAALQAGKTLDDILPEAFAVVREVSRRVTGMRHFDVQLMGGIILHQGKIAEMATGEGKTLVATLPVYLNALEGKGVHVVTVNDYLAKRDRGWMGPIYEFLGLTVGVIQHGLDTAERQQAYGSDITYGTNNEYGFDYLRDNMVPDRESRVQRPLHYAIVDEVDSILVDEARTPLIISGPAEESTDKYYKARRAALSMKGYKITQEKIDPEWKAKLEQLKKEHDYIADEKAKTISLTESGETKGAKAMGVPNLHDINTIDERHQIMTALRAKEFFEKDVEYIVKEGKVIIVDEFTGRLMPGRRFSDGLHQALEAKESVPIERENQTLGTITFQNYFRMYKKLAGMTGTAATEAVEFEKIYKLDTIVIPTNKTNQRADAPDAVYKNEHGKFKAVVKEIAKMHKEGRPVLVGTVSIDKSERISDLLKRENLPHTVLNAKYHEKEAEIVARAGQPAAITIATNMAGRGTDIVLGEAVAEKGGLHVIGTERHEARRIDNQLRGRCARQGDPGTSQFFISLEDDLMRLFGSDKLKNIMDTFGMSDEEEIRHGLVSRAIEQAQKRVEARNFDIRKHLLEYDDVMNRQREIIYDERKLVLESESIDQHVLDMTEEVAQTIEAQFLGENASKEEDDPEGKFLNSLQEKFGYSMEPLKEEVFDKETRSIAVMEHLKKIYEEKKSRLTNELFQYLQRSILLQVIDTKWKDHLRSLDDLREGIGLRAYGQRDPLVEYKREAFDLFEAMSDSVKQEAVELIFRVDVVKADKMQSVFGGDQQLIHEEKTAFEGPGAQDTESPGGASEIFSGAPAVPTQKLQPVHRATPKVGRNEPCPCGSGKKYKKCCGA